jgi:hypothetical protein
VFRRHFWLQCLAIVDRSSQITIKEPCARKIATLELACPQIDRLQGCISKITSDKSRTNAAILSTQAMKASIAKRAALKYRIVKTDYQLRTIEPALNPVALGHAHSIQTATLKDALPESRASEIAVEMDSLETQASHILFDDLATIHFGDGNSHTLSRLTTHGPSRAGTAAYANPHHLHDLRLPTGSGSGDSVRRQTHNLKSSRRKCWNIWHGHIDCTICSPLAFGALFKMANF